MWYNHFFGCQHVVQIICLVPKMLYSVILLAKVWRRKIWLLVALDAGFQAQDVLVATQRRLQSGWLRRRLLRQQRQPQQQKEPVVKLKLIGKKWRRQRHALQRSARGDNGP